MNLRALGVDEARVRNPQLLQDLVVEGNVRLARILSTLLEEKLTI